MSQTAPAEFTEDGVPLGGIEENVAELVELYGGEMTASRENARQFVLPLRRGVSVSGGVECTLSWSGDTLKLVCDRDIDAPRGQRIGMLSAGVVGALLFTIWPFFPKQSTQLGAVAWIGGAVALAVYFLSLRKTSGGLAFDFLQRLAGRQRALANGATAEESGE